MMDFFQMKHRLYGMACSLKTTFWYKLFLKECGKSNVIISPFFLSLHELSLGSHILIFNFARIEAVRSYEGYSFQPSIVIHDNVQIQQGLHLTCASKVVIGSHTSIGAYVTITDIHHPYEDINLPIEKQPITTQKVEIGADCKIYNNSVILPGTIIGKHCTVGANSVVKGLFPDYSVIVGSPARIVKRYNNESQSWQRTNSDGNFI